MARTCASVSPVNLHFVNRLSRQVRCQRALVQFHRLTAVTEAEGHLISGKEKEGVDSNKALRRRVGVSEMNIEPRRHPLERSAGGMPHRGSCVSSGGKTKGVDFLVNPPVTDTGVAADAASRIPATADAERKSSGSDATATPLTIRYSTVLKANTVCVSYFSPGRRTVLGNSGWFGESG